jgi:hypothetical protein
MPGKGKGQSGAKANQDADGKEPCSSRLCI